MKTYALLMILLGYIFLWIGYKIHFGHTHLIHDYHQRNIQEEDKTHYARFFSLGIYGISGSLFSSGMISLFIKSTKISAFIAVIGVIISLIVIVIVQRKYNGKIFS